MALPYSHTATITRPGDASAASLDDFGQPTASIDAVSVYSGAIDWQDKSFRVRRTSGGSESLQGVFDGYFPPQKFPAGIQVDDYIETTIKGVARTGRVVDVDYLEESIEARFGA